MSTPSGFRPFLTNQADGCNWYWRPNPDGTHTMCMVQDTDAIVEDAKAQRNSGSVRGRLAAKGRWGVKAASIPLSLWLKWKNEEGWDAFDPNYSDKLKQKLNDPDYAYLRTSEFRV